MGERLLENDGLLLCFSLCVCVGGGAGVKNPCKFF